MTAYRENAYVEDNKTMAERMFERAQATKDERRRALEQKRLELVLTTKNNYSEILNRLSKMADDGEFSTTYYELVGSMNTSIHKDTVLRLLQTDGFSTEAKPSTTRVSGDYRISWRKKDTQRDIQPKTPDKQNEVIKESKRSWWGFKK